VNKSFAFTINASSMLRVYDMDYDSPTWDMVPRRADHLDHPERPADDRASARLDHPRLADQPENALRLNLEHVQINTPTRQNVYATAWGAGNTGGATFTQGAAAGNDLVRQT
jgi:hypothetical protein